MLLLATLLLALLPARAQQDVISRIEIHGNRRIPAETIRARIFTKEGDIYDQAALERDFNSLWNTGYFEDLRFEREQSAKGWIIHIYVKEKPTIREIKYVGLKSVSQSDVLDRFKALTRKNMIATIPEFLNQDARIWARHFSKDELKQIDQFYRSKAGRDLVAKMPKVRQQTMPMADNWGRAEGAEAMKAAIKQLRKEGVKI